jgi:hypothetical protein
VSNLRRALVSLGRIQAYTLGSARLTCDVVFGTRLFVLRAHGIGDAHAKLYFHRCRLSTNPMEELAKFLEKTEDAIAIRALESMIQSSTPETSHASN